MRLFKVIDYRRGSYCIIKGQSEKTVAKRFFGDGYLELRKMGDGAFHVSQDVFGRMNSVGEIVPIESAPEYGVWKKVSDDPLYSMKRTSMRNLRMSDEPTHKIGKKR